MLLFPVKLARSVLFVLAVAGASLPGCGYRSAHDARAMPAPLSVAAAPFRTPHLEALDAALAGARAELARERALGTNRYPRLVVELLRVDEVATGIRAERVGGEATPLARGSAVGVVLRSWIEESPGGPPVRFSGDVRRVMVVAQDGRSHPDRLRFSQAVNSAARRAGGAAARRSLGRAEPALERL
jgi:hypothetical protein